MKLLENILLATDLSTSSENIVKNAIVLAKTFQSKITLVHVLPSDIKNEKTQLFLTEAAKNMLKVIKERIGNEGIEIEEPIMEFGSPYDKIVKTAVAVKANIILVGSGEKAKTVPFKLGTTAKRIIQKSDKPVWVVKNDHPIKVKKILCPVDFSQTSKRALQNAITMARRFKAALTILTVYESQSSSFLPFKDELVMEKIRVEYTENLSNFLKAFNLTDLDCTQEIHEGDPAKEILLEISKNKPDLLVMGTTGKSGLSKIIIGSVTEKVIREVPCSFMTLKAKDAISLQLESKIRDIESHFGIAKQLMEDGFLEESINEYMVCLTINNMHIPSLHGLAKVYEKLNDLDSSRNYKRLAREILDRIWDRKIEDEIRKFKTF